MIWGPCEESVQSSWGLMSLRTSKKASVPRARRVSVGEIALEGRPGLSSCKALPASAGIFLLPVGRGEALEVLTGLAL